VEALDLSACEILVRVDGPDLTVRRERRGATLGERRELDLEVEGARVGSLVAILPADEHELDANARRLFEAAGRQISVVLERARLDARIEDARTLVQTNQVRAALFSSVTHDLRTPLASIKAGVTTLLQEDVDLGEHERLELLRTILEETDRLNRLVGNILDLARVRAGALVPDKVPTALEEVVDSVLHRMGPRLAHVRVRTILRDAPDVPADPVQVDQVLTNLIENAVRHSPDGGEVTISVAPWRGGVQVRVTDQGPGVAPEDRERVFDAFVSGQGGSIAAAGERAGSGLGLAIARAIVLAHGGRIWIEGSPSGGASVVFELPVGDAAPVEQEVVREGRP
jgi:two-component system, OmpR family, sensor histidine kinase KdpD